MPDQVYYNDIEPFCCDVLRARIADGNLYAGRVDQRDIREIHGDELRDFGQIHLFAGIGGFPLGFRWARVPAHFDILTGGFPCQDISVAGKGAGLAGERSGLWAEQIRIIRERNRTKRIHWVVVENVPALRTRGADTVLANLAAEGYTCWPLVVEAASVGLPQEGPRVWIVAASRSERIPRPFTSTHPGAAGSWREGCPEALHMGLIPWLDEAFRCGGGESPLLGEGHGVSAWVDRVKALGNAVVPQIPMLLGRAILRLDRELNGPNQGT